jgi:uncharacterized protein involved in exopolysaccharide biosynthesis
VVLAIAAIALAAGLYVASREEPKYSNSARLLVSPLSQATGQLLGIDYLRSAGDADRTAQTAAVLIESNDVAQEAARRLGGEWTRASVLEAVEVSPESDSNVLAVTATTTDPASATRVANAVATGVVELRRSRIQRQIAARIRDLRRDLRGLADDDYAARDNVLQELQELGGARQRGDLSLTIAQTAVMPGETIRTPTVLIAALALVGGLLLGVLAALLLDRLRRPHRPEGDGEPTGHKNFAEPPTPADVVRPAPEPVR